MGTVTNMLEPLVKYSRFPLRNELQDMEKAATPILPRVSMKAATESAKVYFDEARTEYVVLEGNRKFKHNVIIGTHVNRLHERGE